jgi:hypothetical protein
MRDFLELFIAWNRCSLYCTGSQRKSFFREEIEPKRSLLFREIKLSFREIQCYVEWPILYYKTEQNKQNEITQKCNIFTE